MLTSIAAVHFDMIRSATFTDLAMLHAGNEANRATADAIRSLRHITDITNPP
jgi:hypothetical protein